jgi:hypothetical protein
MPHIIVSFAARVEIITTDKGATCLGCKKPPEMHLHHATIKARKNKNK